MEALTNDMQEVFRTVFGDDQLELSEAMTAADVDGWDSLAHLNLIVAIEKRFGVKFATAEISRLKGEGSNVGTMLELLGSEAELREQPASERLQHQVLATFDPGVGTLLLAANGSAAPGISGAVQRRISLHPGPQRDRLGGLGSLPGERVCRRSRARGVARTGGFLPCM